MSKPNGSTERAPSGPSIKKVQTLQEYCNSREDRKNYGYKCDATCKYEKHCDSTFNKLSHLTVEEAIKYHEDDRVALEDEITDFKQATEQLPEQINKRTLALGSDKHMISITIGEVLGIINSTLEIPDIYKDE